MEPILIEGLRTVFVVGLPIAGLVVLAGVVVAGVQSAMTVTEPALGYVVRLLAFIVAGYLFLPAAIETVTKLAETAWR